MAAGGSAADLVGGILREGIIDSHQTTVKGKYNLLIIWTLQDF